MSDTWRDKARAVILPIVNKMGRDDPKALRRALSEAYPFGPRTYHPYKVWCEEVTKAVTGHGVHTRVRIKKVMHWDTLPSMREFAKKHGVYNDPKEPTE